MSKRRVIVLGCGGFVGSHLTDRLLENGEFEVIGYDLTSKKCAHHLGNPDFSFTESYVDGTNTEALLGPLLEKGDIEAVFSLAAVCNPAEYNKNPTHTINSNFIHAYKLVDLCAKMGTWLIHTSTCEIYGRTVSSYIPGDDYSNPDLYEQNETTTPLVHGPITNSRWTYAAAKALFERYIYANHVDAKLPFTIIRPYNWFGPRMDYIPGRDGEGVPRVLACFMTALMDGKPLQLVDGGGAYRTITYIQDAVDALMALLEKPESAQNQFFNIGNRNNEITMRELAHAMRDIYADITGDESYRNHPIVDVSGEEFYGPGYEDCDRRVVDNTNARTKLDWDPKFDIKGTLEPTLRYFFEAYAQNATQPA